MLLADKYNWTPDQVGRLTRDQVQTYIDGGSSGSDASMTFHSNEELMAYMAGKTR